MKVKVKVKITDLPITLVLLVIQTSNLSHIVAHGKAKNVLHTRSKMKVKFM